MKAPITYHHHEIVIEGEVRRIRINNYHNGLLVRRSPECRQWVLTRMFYSNSYRKNGVWTAKRSSLRRVTVKMLLVDWDRKYPPKIDRVAAKARKLTKAFEERM